MRRIRNHLALLLTAVTLCTSTANAAVFEPVFEEIESFEQVQTPDTGMDSFVFTEVIPEEPVFDTFEEVFCKDDPTSLENAQILLDSDLFLYTGTPVIPSVSVYYEGTLLTEGIDYTVTCLNNTMPGTASAVVTGTGHFTGTVTFSFTITEEHSSTAEGLFLKSGKWYYRRSDGSFAIGWRKIGEIWYYFDPATYEALTGFRKLGNCIYYFDTTGKMQTGFVEVGGSV